MANEIPKFTTIQYQTSSGENCTATKKDGVVTIQGDKEGVRQMPLDEFMQTFIKDQSQKTLERTPEKDKVNFSGKSQQKANLSSYEQKLQHKRKIGNIFTSLGIIGTLGSLVPFFKNIKPALFGSVAVASLIVMFGGALASDEAKEKLDAYELVREASRNN